MKPLRVTGEWWLPGETSRKLYGTLTFEQNSRPMLETIGRFTDADREIAAYESILIVLGVADGKLVTLYRVREVHVQNLFSLGNANVSYQIEFAFVGDHIESEDELVFDRVAVEYSDLPEWSGRSGLSLSVSRTDGIDVQARYRRPEPLSVGLEDGSRIRFWSGFGTEETRFRSITLRESNTVELLPSTPLSVDALLHGMCWSLRTLITLGMGRPQQITSFQVHPARYVSSHDPFPVDILFPQSRGNDGIGVRRPGLDALFSLADLGDNAEARVQAWIKRAEALRPVLNFYFASFFSDFMLMDHQFLDVVQAAESYHRRTYNGRYLQMDQFDEIRAAVIRAIPPTTDRIFVDAFKNKLKHANDFSQRRRLKELISAHASLAAPVLPGPGSFVEDVIKTRNYLTHLDESAKAGARTSGSELLAMTLRLRVLLQVCFLREIGLSEDRIKRAVRNSYEFKHVSTLVDGGDCIG